MARPPRVLPPKLRAPLDFRDTLDDLVLRAVGPAGSAALQGWHWALDKYAPDISEPPIAAAVLPVAGSGWQAIEDLQEGDYAGALFNGGVAGLEMVPGVAVVTKGVAVAKVGGKLKYVNKLGSKPQTASNVQKAYSAAGLTGKKVGMEAHHTFPVADIPKVAGVKPRSIPNWRNSPWLIEPLPIDIHRRLTGSWKGKERFGPLGQAWYGSSSLLRAAAAGAAGQIMDGVENAMRTQEPTSPKRKP